MIIRKAILTDAPMIAKVHVDSWRTTYKDIIPKAFLDKLSYEQRTELWYRNISEENNYVLVAENDQGELVGFADAWKRETNTEEDSIDLTSIYLLEEYQGMAIGKKLLKELFKYFKQMNYERVFVEVLADNQTRYFYEYYGAKLVNTVQVKIGEKILNEIIYEWDSVDKVIEKL